jgi:hypothetical protein
MRHCFVPLRMHSWCLIKLDLNFVALVIVEKRDETPEKENCENAIPE